MSAPAPAPHKEFGSVVTLAIQLAHFEHYGLRDRIAYHLALLRDGLQSSSEGISSILECVSTKPFHKFDKAQRRLFKRSLKKLSLPFRVSPQTRVYFAYATTRMAFVLDASPTVTSTFGFSSRSSSCCPIDGLIPMARDYFTALIQDIPCQNRTWTPEISITVVAVYPKDENQSPTSFLVRDYRIVDLASAELLLEKLEEWCSGEVESEIAKRLSASKGILPVNASSMHDLLDAGQAALASLSSTARPCVVVATDCRSLACDSIIDVTTELNRVDVPVSVLDLSPPSVDIAKENCAALMNDDLTGAIFPLHLSDDAEFVVRLCQATNGAYWNASILAQAAKTKAGNVPVSSALNRDHFFTFKRHTLCANAVQWYTLVELSSLSPVPQLEWGRLSPSLLRPTRRGLQARTTLQSYELNPAPLHDILLLRVKQGYRAKQCGVGETERFSIHLTLQLDLGTTIHYELSYSAGHPLFGVAQVKMELSGDSNFVLAVKYDFLHGRSGRPVTMAQHVSAKLCAHAVSVRKEDLMQVMLSPIKWAEHLASPGTAFLQKIASLSMAQYSRHFSRDEFECVCHGRMPWEDNDSNEYEDSAGQLFTCIRQWCSQHVSDDTFIKQIDPYCGVGGFIIVKVLRCAYASRLFTVSIESFASTSAKLRHKIICELKAEIQKHRSVEILPKQMGQYLVGHNRGAGQGIGVDPYVRILESQYSHESWDLVKDVELIPLVMRRRKEVGKFILLESDEKHTLFAKLLGCDDEESNRDPGTHVQYKLSVLDDRVVADLHMEFESQQFFPLRQETSKFHHLHKTLRTREKECARALQCRTTILRTIETEDNNTVPSAVLGDSLASCVRRLLTYASVTSLPLRFFGARNKAGNECLRNLTIEALTAPTLGLKVASLAVRDGGSGDWFAVEHDKETLSLVHISQISTIDNGTSIVRVDIHTISLEKMYRKQDDDEVDSDSHGHAIHPQVASFRNQIESTHKRHVSRAAYLTLLTEAECFDPKDVEEALVALEFVQTAELSIPGESTSHHSLAQTLANVLTPVVGVPGLFVFKRADDLGEWSPYHDQHDNALENDDEKSDVNDVDNASTASSEESSQGSFDFDSHSASSGKEDNEDVLLNPPIFVRFLKDGQLVDQCELTVAESRAKITVLLSIFISSPTSMKSQQWRKFILGEIPRSHEGAAFQISTLFHAYSAEQTLERLRGFGSEIEQSNISIARSCLRKARKIVSMTIDVYFYSTKSDSIVRSYSLSIGDTGLDEGFKLVSAYLKKYKGAQKYLQCGSANSFVAMETKDSSLRYWCFLSIQKTRGVILIDLWHPEGEAIASTVMQKTVDVVAEACHKVNQFILLRHLHQSRCASELLVANQAGTNSTKGQFGCEVVHRETLELYHRCASNVKQVIRTLESSVLHNFAVSNRRSLFVYKDESDSVFYLCLRPQTRDDVESIELLVHGIETPGPSIRCQLVNLLKRRLLAIGVDYLATVLTINPLYTWKEEDLLFVSSFESIWAKVDEASLESPIFVPAPRERLYSFPECVYDPGLVMLYFRQNILGSSYFYPVTASEDSMQLGEHMSATIDNDDFLFNNSTFLFYFNASRSKANPILQSENTLTERGAALARKAGSGLALVTVSFECKTPVKMAVPLPQSEGDNFFACEPIQLHEADSKEMHEKPIIRVAVTDTMLDRDALHDWIQLCFNQVIVAWTIERNLERMQLGNMSTDTGPTTSRTILPGLPHLTQLLEKSSSLPHPAIQVVEMKGVIRSSSVASCLSELLRSIMDEFPPESKKAFGHQIIIRSSRSGQAAVVQLESLSNTKVRATRFDETIRSNKVAVDSPIECPEYTVFFSTEVSTLNTPSGQPCFPKVFNDVAVTNETLFSAYKTSHPRQFYRSFAFILVVKRNLRKLYAYNWKAQLIHQVTTKLKEIDKANIWRAAKITETSLSESLGTLAPKKTLAPSKHQRKRITDFNDAVSIASESCSDMDKEVVQYRKKRNQPIRRPKLVGKSVDGSAAQAVALSRARARFKPQMQPASKSVSNATPTGAASLANQTKAMKGTQTKEDWASTAGNSQGLSRYKRHLDAKLNRYPNDSVASARCSFYQSATTSVFDAGADEVPVPTMDLFFRAGSLFWVEATESPQLPRALDDKFLQNFAILLCEAMPRLSIMSGSSSDSTIYLQSKHRTVSQCKCFEIIKLETEKLENNRWRILAEGRLLRVARRPGAKKRFVWQLLNERDATAFNILTSKRRVQLLLKPRTFDCAMIRLVKVFDMPSELLIQSALDALNSLTNGYTLQPVRSKSAYKCFQLELKVSSYENPMISLYPCVTLMKWLYRNSVSRSLLRCAAQSLCFRREVNVNSTSSVIFISLDTANGVETVQASVLCDTKNKDIECLVKCEDFDVLVTTYDLIAFEIAGVVFRELLFAARAIRQEELWNLFSMPSDGRNKPSLKDCSEALNLCYTKSVLEILSNEDKINFFSLAERCVARRGIQQMMADDDAFAPHFCFEWQNGATTDMFYMGTEKLFLLLNSNHDQTSCSVLLLASEPISNNNPSVLAALQKLSNFMLHWLWNDIVSSCP